VFTTKARGIFRLQTSDFRCYISLFSTSDFTLQTWVLLLYKRYYQPLKTRHFKIPLAFVVNTARFYPFLSTLTKLYQHKIHPYMGQRQGRHTSIIGPRTKQCIGVPTYTNTHRNKSVIVDKIKHIFIKYLDRYCYICKMELSTEERNCVCK
jgi:hypothetical protein